MSIWRLLKHESNNGFFNMAVDEAMLQSRIEERTPNTLRLFRWRPSTVSIGRFQNVDHEVNLAHCETDGVNVVRRISGGGAVYHDSEDEITYSVTVKREDLGTNDVTEAYTRICNGLVEAAHILSVDAKYSEGNVRQCPNITVRGRKISGSAQAHRKGVTLQHGTFLIDVDLKRMFRFLRFPWKRSHVDCISVAERKITSVAAELGHRVSVDQVYRAFAEGFEQALDVKFVESGLTSYELNAARKLVEEKFAAPEWNLGGKTVASILKPVS
jgi:lipoate-protein ligase A